MWNRWKEVKGKFHPEIRDVWTVKDIVERSAEVWGNKTYMVYAPNGSQYTYNDLNKIANKIANSLSELGVSKGDRVALYMRNIPEYVFSMYACAKLGAIEVPVNWYFREREVSHVLGTAEVSTIIVENDKEFLEILGKAADGLEHLRRVIIVGEGSNSVNLPFDVHFLSELVKRADDSNPETEVKDNDLMCIMFTSGTTGLPKGTMLSHRSFTISARSFCALPISKGDRNYTCLPLFHGNAQFYSTTGMLNLGGSVVLSDRFSPSKFFKEIAEYDATFFNSIGGIMQILDSYYDDPNKIPKHNAKYVAVGGTPKELWKRFEEKFGVEILEIYSQTESPTLFGNAHPDRSKRKIGSFGIPIFPDLGHVAKIINEKGEEIEVGVGELVRKDPAHMEGYWNDPEKTKETLRDGWIYSGDIVMKDEDGFYYFMDRKKFMIRRAGENVSTYEVEDVINEHPAVEESAVIPAPDPLREEEVKAMIVLKGGVKVSPEEIIEHCAKRLAYFKVPRYIEFVEELPKTPTQRVQKALLKEMEKNRKDHGWDRDKHMPDWRKKFYGF